MDQISNQENEPYRGRNSTSTGSANQDQQEHLTIPVIEERVHLDKRVVETGSVRITKVITEQEVPLNIPLIQEEHDIQHVPVNQYVDSPPPPIRYEGDTMIIPIVQEVMVVEKRLMVIEELHITKNKVQTNDVQQISLRKEEIRIERIPSDQTGNSGS
ncbi:YsnF/AvaK domain-containing protein [Rufibacter tibetensis]|uniref:YsnF/AvaK domain-containing protein n=1 Tax=Rufibacter tibetensis TaxID=512763 RepID=UPI0009FB9345|nr:YsnF/AvaK domain-containing protein [Rufibacter tibetensis]